MATLHLDVLPNRRQTIAAITIGNALEFFDFTVYGFLVLTIGKLFFPTFSSSGQLLLTVASFGVGFVARPLGGILIGTYADRAGRKKAMTLTIFLMALGCAVITFAPTYAQIGVIAPLLILLARLMQGFAAGGEVGASTALLIEHGASNNRGFMGSWQYASQCLGVLLGAIVVGALTFSLTRHDMEDWGWRVPFAVGMLIAPVGVYIRRHLKESLDVAPEALADRRSGIALVCTQHGKTAFAATLSAAGFTTAAYVVALYMPTYAVRELGLAPTISLFGAAIFGGVSFVLSPLVGKLSDLTGRKSLILVARVTLVVFIYPGFLWLNAEPTPTTLFIVTALLSAVVVLQTVPGMTMLPEAFPKHIRATGMSLTYGVGVALFGGFAPFIGTWLVQATGNKIAPAWYLIAITIVSLISLLWLREQAGREIDSETDYYVG